MKKIIILFLLLISYQANSQKVSPDSVLRIALHIHQDTPKFISDAIIISALKAVDSVYGRDMTLSIERLFRNETNHFRSGNFCRTLSPGMQIGRHDTLNPFGWFSLAPFWRMFPVCAPCGVFRQRENNSALAKAEGIQTFLVFHTLKASMLSIAYHLHQKDETHKNPGVWFSAQPDLQKKYSEYLLRIYPLYSLKYIYK